MKDKLLSHEGPVFSILDKLGQMILLSIVWMIGCIPVLTIGTSTTALYYAVIKSIRRDHGSALWEFWRSYRGNLKRGIPVTLIILSTSLLLWGNIQYLSQAESTQTFLLLGSVILLCLILATAVYICPVLSRFSMNAYSAVKLAFVMAIRYFPVTVLLTAGTAGLFYLQIFVLPMATVLILPAAWCFAGTFPMEKILRKFMPPKEDGDDAWYYQ